MSTQNHYAIFRFRKLKTDADIINAGIHNERLKIPPNADASRVALNRYYAIKNEDLLVRVTRMISERAPRKHRRDAIRALEIICTTSRGWNGNLDQWTLDSLNFVEQTFGKSNIVSAALHQDETTPHLHLVIVPIHEGKLRGSHWIDGPAKCQVLQDGYHAAVQHHGLLRGEAGSTREHVPISDLHSLNATARQAIEEAIQSLPTIKIWESPEAYAKRAFTHLSEQLGPLAQDASAVLLFEAERQARLASERLAREEREKRRSAEAEVERLRKSEIDRLRRLDLADVAQRITGLTPKREGVSVVFENESMKLVITGEKFKDFKSTARGDAGAISLVQHILECNFTEAVRWLATEYGESVRGEAMRAYEAAVNSAVVKAHLNPVTLAEKLERFASKDESRWPAAREYLVSQRAIPCDLVDDLHAAGEIWANPKGGVCFAKRNALGNITGVVVRGTQSDFKQCIGSKASGWFEIGKGRIVAVTESPIDALSLHSMSGLRVLTSDGEGDARALCLHVSSGGRTVDLLFAAQDSDSVGEKQARALMEEAESLSINARRLLCEAHDWNELLQKLKRSLAAAGTWTLQVVKTLSERLGIIKQGDNSPRQGL